MSAIQIDIMTGPGTLRREQFAGPVVRFGRDADNDIVLTARTASRHHGELRCDDGQWSIVNLSPNGTWVNGRPFGRRPLRLANLDTVSIGDQAVFQVALLPAEAEPEPAPGADARPAAPAKRRNKIVVYGSIYAAIVLALLLFGLLWDTQPADQQTAAPPALTAEQIAQAITRLPKVAAVDPDQSTRELQRARELVGRLEASPRNLYDAHRAYQLALAYAGKERFDAGEDERNRLSLQNRLIEKTTEVYKDAYLRLRSQQFQDAEREFRRLTQDIYPDTESVIFRNVETQRRVAAEARQRRRS